MTHPKTRRALWHPALPFALLLVSAYRLAQGHTGWTTLAAASVVGLWLVLAAYDRATRHRLLDWLYSEEGE